MSGRNRKMTRASMVSKDSTPVPAISGDLKKVGRGKRWGLMNNEYFLLYMDRVEQKKGEEMPEPRSKYNVKDLESVFAKENRFSCKFLDGTTRDFEVVDAATASSWVVNIKKRMDWFQELTCAKDSEIKMSLITKEKQAAKLKLEAATKLEEIQKMAHELEEKEKALKVKAKALEEKMKTMREQQEKAKLEMQQWERHLEEKESSMLARADKTLKNRTTKITGSLRDMFGFGKKKTPRSSKASSKLKVTVQNSSKEEGEENQQNDVTLAATCPETGDSFTVSPVGLRFRVDAGNDMGKARKLAARRASAAVGTLREMRRVKRQGLLSAPSKAQSLLGAVPEKDSVQWKEGVRTMTTNKKKKEEEKKTGDKDDATTLLRNAIAESIGYSGMEHLARVSKHELETANDHVGRKSARSTSIVKLPLNFDEVFEYTLSKNVSCKDYAPSVFSSIRKSFGINDREYIQSMRSLTGGGEGEGKSKMLFFMSKDKRYVMKTVKGHELEFFWQFIKDYYWHMIANPDTLICRFFGLFTTIYENKKGDKKKYHLVVMKNIFKTSWPIHLKFDLKGSINNRIVPPDMLDKVSVLKDLNLGQRHVWLPADTKADLARQIEVDTWFLERNNIMDYSLLLGISKPLKTPPKSRTKTETGERLSRWERDGGGILCSRGALRRSDTPDVNAHECYVLSIIDILQQFTWKKQAESMYKVQKYGSAAHISCVDAETYAARFKDFMNNSVIQKYTWLRNSLQDHRGPGRPTIRNRSKKSMEDMRRGITTTD